MAKGVRVGAFWRSPVPVGALAFGVVVSVGAVGVATHSIGLAAAAAVLLGVAATVVGLWPRTKALARLGLTALAAVVALVAGLGLGIRAYDERFIYDNPAPVWDALSLVGFFLTIAGVLMLAGAAIGVLVLVAVRLFR